ncbi:DUF4421 family protein [Pseudotamlana agarivorans]|uniref:DUF4421 family protein n=1 Tax=Pseudotamlana agarivorans TaxID=481183 RepID=UPI000AFB38E7|nr:DUF4421 family protein [Tamlana agarivorans]
MLKPFLIMLCLIIFVPFSNAQTKKLDSLSTKQIIDTLLIDRELKNWSIRLFTNYKGQSFNLKNGENKLSFKPNNRAGVGVGLGTSKLIVDVAFNLKGLEENPTERFDLQGAVIVGNNHLVGLYVQHYKGFNVTNNFGEPEFFSRDITSFSMGVNYLHTFDEISFSTATLRAGLMKAEKKHYISYGVGGFMIYDNFSANDALIPDRDFFDSDAYINEFKGVGVGVSAGVLSVFVLPANFFVTLNVIPGIGLMHKRTFTEEDKHTVSNPLIYKLDYNAGVGYVYKRFYVTFVYGSCVYTSSLDHGLDYVFSNTKAKIAIGYKLNSKKKLKLPFEGK